MYRLLTLPDNRIALTIHNDHTFLVNFSVFISTNPALTAFMKDNWLLKVTRPLPIGYLNLSVSMPEYITPPNKSSIT